MAEYTILKERQEGRKYVYYCETTGALQFRVGLLHKLKSQRGEDIHLGGGADRAITKAAEPIHVPELTYSESEVTQILRDKKYLAVDESFSEKMPEKVVAVG